MTVARARSAERRLRAKTPVRRAPAKRRPSTIERAVDHLPVSRDALRRAGNWVLGGGIIAALVAGLVAMGLPQMIGLLMVEAIGDAGFKVRNVEILNRRQVDSAHPPSPARRARPTIGPRLGWQLRGIATARLFGTWASS